MMNQLVNLKMHGEIILKMDERHCEIFQSLALGNIEGYEIYNPLIQSILIYWTTLMDLNLLNLIRLIKY